ncbi:unnamed protein product [Ceratitis capitata]|uniref:(Mediterranean fruit fly) hypothetical protein n=1 Tax=Ceratitis capitata TaxID=7213 RepID=A0A811UH50_CERCA|nr:unnamed protein product [Ceratitis capitata]
MDDMPDLSHLTPHERMQIETVLMRQKQEEEAHNEIMRNFVLFTDQNATMKKGRVRRKQKQEKVDEAKQVRQIK